MVIDTFPAASRGGTVVFEHFTVQWMTTPAGSSCFGCFAKEEIPKHTLIHQEEPLLKSNDIWKAVEGYESGEHATHQDEVDYLQNNVGLSSEQQAQLWKLHDQRHNPARLMGLIYSNAFSNSDQSREPCLYVGATSRFNHSCRPNVGMDFAGWNIRLFTSRDIAAGEELCLSYNQIIYYHTREERRKVLQDKYRFDCQCVACQDIRDDDDAFRSNDISDERRIRLRLLARQLVSQVPEAHFLWDAYSEEGAQKFLDSSTGIEEYNLLERLTPFDLSMSSSLKLLHEYFLLLQQEGMENDLLQASELAFDIACWKEPRSGTDTIAHWARQTMTLYRLHKGPDHIATKTFRAKLQSKGIRVDVVH